MRENLQSRAPSRSPSSRRRTSCSGRGDGARSLGVTMILEGSKPGSLEEFMKESFVRRRLLVSFAQRKRHDNGLHRSCSHSTPSMKSEIHFLGLPSRKTSEHDARQHPTGSRAFKTAHRSLCPTPNFMVQACLC